MVLGRLRGQVAVPMAGLVARNVPGWGNTHTWPAGLYRAQSLGLCEARAELGVLYVRGLKARLGDLAPLPREPLVPWGVTGSDSDQNKLYGMLLTGTGKAVMKQQGAQGGEGTVDLHQGNGGGGRRLHPRVCEDGMWRLRAEVAAHPAVRASPAQAPLSR